MRLLPFKRKDKEKEDGQAEKTLAAEGAEEERQPRPAAGDGGRGEDDNSQPPDSAESLAEAEERLRRLAKDKKAAKAKAKGKKEAMRLELPSLSLAMFTAPPPEGKIRSRYQVGINTITIVGKDYHVQDPHIDDADLRHLKAIAPKLLFILPPEALGTPGALAKALAPLGIDDPRLLAILSREISGFGLLEPLMNDDRIEDVMVWPEATLCNHRDFGTLRVNLALSEAEVNRYIEKLVHSSGKAVSLYNPIMSIRLPTNDRLTVTYQREVSDRPSFTVRKFPRQPWSIASVMVMGTLSPEMAAWLTTAVKHKKAILVCGPVGSGKTSLINALCSLIPADKVIVTVEDTPELRLARSNWFSLITRESMTVEEKGTIDMFSLVKHALRQPADYITVGEVRGEEGRIWAQAIATGHGGLTSLHAETPEGAIERLRSDPINVSDGALAALSTLVIQKAVPIKRGGDVLKARRVIGVYDIAPKHWEPEEGTCTEPIKEVGPIKIIPVFKYNYAADSFACVTDPLKTHTAASISESIPEHQLSAEYALLRSFMSRLLQLVPANPALGDHAKVTTLMETLYDTSALPEELAPPQRVAAARG